MKRRNNFDLFRSRGYVNLYADSACLVHKFCVTYGDVKVVEFSTNDYFVWQKGSVVDTGMLLRAICDHFKFKYTKKRIFYENENDKCWDKEEHIKVYLYNKKHYYFMQGIVKCFEENGFHCIFDRAQLVCVELLDSNDKVIDSYSGFTKYPEEPFRL